MTFLLGTQNVFGYLIKKGLCKSIEQEQSKIEPKVCKNFNLLVTQRNNHSFLLKQEPHDKMGKTRGDLFCEWQIHRWLQEFPELVNIRHLVSEAIDFDIAHSIIIFNYLADYSDLGDFYNERQVFPLLIAENIGNSLGMIHHITFNSQVHKDFLSKDRKCIDSIPNFSKGLDRINPEMLAVIEADGLFFFELYQRYENLGRAISELNDSFQACCLTHNDLKFNNILLHKKWEQNSLRLSDQSFTINKSEECTNGSGSLVRLIDWERWTWGDPGFDLGTLIGSYIKIWLNSLVINSDIDISMALSLAKIPLEVVQPSIVALTRAYLLKFPEILVHRPDFLYRVVQFAGLDLIEKIQAMIYYREPFGNIEICMLEVAKTLLCDPKQSFSIIFGVSESELTSQLNIV